MKSRRRKRRNPDSVPALTQSTPAVSRPSSSGGLGGLKNWLVLGGFVVGGYYVYKYFQSPAIDALRQEISSSSGGSGPDLNGPMVSRFQIASTQATNCISEPAPGFVYAPVSSYNPITKFNTFSATANGHFTRRLLCKGSQRWAEIHPV